MSLNAPSLFFIYYILFTKIRKNFRFELKIKAGLDTANDVMFAIPADRTLCSDFLNDRMSVSVLRSGVS